MERETVEVYERQAADYEARRPPRHRERAHAFRAQPRPAPLVLDAGCGPGGYLGDLGDDVVGIDAAGAMLDLSRRAAPGVPLVRGDLEALPFRRGAFGGTWARNSYLHVPKARLPLALARLHDALEVGAPIRLTVLHGDHEGPWPDDDLGGRFFTSWTVDDITAVVEGAGFSIDGTEVQGETIWISATRSRTLPDFVGPGMRLLVCGLNPSEVAADAGYGYAGATNRFWRAAVEAGLTHHPRDPIATLTQDHVGMTDLVKRATPRSSLLDPGEYRDGVDRMRRVVESQRPALVLFVGLEGWRAGMDRRATPGAQPEAFAGARAYVMPSTSGLNAHSTLADLIVHLSAALALSGRALSGRAPPDRG